MEEILKMYEDFMKYFGYYARKAARDLSGAFFRIGVKPKRVDLEFGMDEACYSSPNENLPGRYLIHMGLMHFGTYPDGTPVCSSEKDMHTQVRYVQDHEEGHILFTTERAWTMAIDNGTKNVVTYIAEHALGRKVRITDEESIKQTIKLVHDQAKLNINLNMIQQMVHFICNSIEDGRMERKMAAMMPGFKTDMRMARGAYWMHAPIGDEENPDEPIGMFFISCNQILSLATTGLWQKGFIKKLSGTNVEKTVRPLIPKIEAGVTARSCKKGMKYAVEIIGDLCPLFYDACVSDVNEQLEQALSGFMNDVGQTLPDLGKNGESKTQYSADEKHDAAEEKKESTQAGQDKNTQQAQSGGLSPDQSAVTEQGQSSFNIFEDGEETGPEGGKAGASGTANAEAGNGSQGTQPQPNAGSQPLAGPKSGDTGTVQNARSGSAGQDVAGKGDDADMVIKAMDAAVEAAAAETSFAEKAIKATGSAKKKEVVDKSTIASAIGDVSDICSDFNEFTRRYKLTEELPADIKEECRTARAKYEHYFVSRRKPAQRGARAGKLDPRSFSRIVMREIDVFQKPGEDNSFSGCIYVLVDNSGSMSGRKKVSAMEICARLEEIFKGLVPLKIAAFDTSRGTNIETIKNWNDDLVKNCSWNFLKYGRDGGGTPTKEALLIAQRELMNRSEQHKLIILITDENAYCAHGDLPKVINSVRKCGIQLSATYIEEYFDENDKEAFERLFGKGDALVAKPDEIVGAILPVVKKFTAK